MTEYDAAVIKKFADALYRQAAGIVITYTVMGVIIGWLGGSWMGGGSGSLGGAIIFGAIGYMLGTQKAFVLKLQAQVALCQVKIEENTHAKS